MERSTKNRLMYFRKHPSRFGGFVMPWKMNLSPVKRFLGNRMLQALQVLKVQVQSVDNRSRGKEIYRGGMDSEVLSGRVLEWSNRTVSKTVVPATVPWVRIPPLPPRRIEFFIKEICVVTAIRIIFYETLSQHHHSYWRGIGDWARTCKAVAGEREYGDRCRTEYGESARNDRRLGHYVCV